MPCTCTCRLDVFSSLGLTVPDTWSELLTAVQAVESSSKNIRGICLDAPMPGDNGGLVGIICIYYGQHVAEQRLLLLMHKLKTCAGCRSGYIVSAMAASMQQYAGTSQGWFMDPGGVGAAPEPLMNTSAMIQALNTFALLWNASGPPAANVGCVPPGAVDDGFASGACAMTLAWDAQFKATHSPASPTRGVLGVSLLPGSTSIMPREQGGPYSSVAMVNCTSVAMCPGASPPSAGSASTPIQLVNRAPFIGDGGYYLMVNSVTGKQYTDAMLNLATWLNLPLTSWAMAVSNYTSGLSGG